MLRRGLEGDLLAGSNTYRGLEAFLTRAARSRPDSIEVNDLLWKFHERNGNHAAAAKILYQLASKPRYVIVNPIILVGHCMLTPWHKLHDFIFQDTDSSQTEGGLFGSCYNVHEK